MLVPADCGFLLQQADVELVHEENELDSRLVPQLTVGEDGQIILNEKRWWMPYVLRQYVVVMSVNVM